MFAKFARHYSTPSTKKATATTDKRYTLLRDMLYSETARHETSAVNTPLDFTTEQREEHELIERMWCLEKMKEQDALRRFLAIQRVSMHNAALALEVASPRLFAAACGIECEDGVARKRDYVQGEDVYLFSPKLRIPTETLPNKI
jgi:hypothetical protein